MNIIVLVVLAFIGEAVWETLKLTWQNGKVSTDRIGALITGLLLAVGANVDLLSMLGITIVIPWLGVILTGLLISRGANFVHDLIGNVNTMFTNGKGTPLGTGIIEVDNQIDPTSVTEFRK